MHAMFIIIMLNIFRGQKVALIQLIGKRTHLGIHLLISLDTFLQAPFFHYEQLLS
jgi:hypothetical protein